MKFDILKSIVLLVLSGPPIITQFAVSLNASLVPPTGFSNGSRVGILIQSQTPMSKRSEIPASWKKLIPLKTTRNEVELLLGKPRRSRGSREIYENDTERVDVVYSTGKCEPVAGRWNVEPSVIIIVDVYPKKIIFLQDLILDKRKYVRHEWAHPEDWVTYRNLEDGIEIDTVYNRKNLEQVRRFSYGPNAEDSKLRCRE